MEVNQVSGAVYECFPKFDVASYSHIKGPVVIVQLFLNYNRQNINIFTYTVTLLSVLIMYQGGVTRIYTLGRFATVVKLKGNGQLKMFSVVNSQAPTFL